MNSKTTLTNKMSKVAQVLFISLTVFACQSETSAQNTETVKAAASEAVVDLKAAIEEKVNTEKPAQPAQVAPKATEKAADEATEKPTGLDESKYVTLSAPIEVSTGDKIEVLELFWFGCGHCYAIEPKVKSWLADKPANAEFVKMPAVFSKRWEIHAQMFYAMYELGVEDKAVDGLFNHIHGKGKHIRDEEDVVKFFSRYGNSDAEIRSAFNSFGVDTKLRNAKIITAKSTARGVPAFLVDGKYQTSVTLAGSETELFEVINQLVEKASAER